jgi:hypothetical protein
MYISKVSKKLRILRWEKYGFWVKKHYSLCLSFKIFCRKTNEALQLKDWYIMKRNNTK